MKTPLYLLLGLLLLISTVQAKPTPTDSLKAQQALMKQQLVELTTGIQKQSKLNDSLSLELMRFQAKEDFYVMAVDRQGSHFEWLLATIIGVAGLFSYAFFLREIKKLKEDWIIQLAQAKDEYSKTEGKLIKVEARIFSILSNLVNRAGLAEMALAAKDKNELLPMLNSFIASLGYLLDSYEIAPETRKEKLLGDFDIITGNLTDGLDMISNFLEGKGDEVRAKFIDDFKDQKGDALKCMYKITQLDHEPASDRALKNSLRIKEMF